MKCKNGYPKNEEDFLSVITCKKGIILNPCYCGQVALTIKNNKFIVVGIEGTEWEFDRFEQACYFMVAIDGKNFDEKGNEIRERAIELFPNEAK